ncbi:MAG: FUSC family protein [Agathobacter sp.]|nr:FUSC family protein [Agathobacter sp.]
MKLNYRRIHIGRRTFKSALAVIIAIIIVSMYGTSSSTSRMVFAMLGAMSAMENTFKQSVEACMTQIVGMLLGAVIAALVSFLPIPSLLMVGIGVVSIIVVYNLLGVHFSPNLPCLVVVMSCMNAEVYPFEYALGRLWDTAIGLAVGMIINVLILPYDNSLKIRQAFEYLEKEVIVFLEDMFDGDKKYPDTEKMRKTIDEMASQLGIYSKQWLPFSVKNDHKKLEIFLQCESMSRELLAQMEVLHHMKAPGRLDPDVRRRLEENGADIRDRRIIVRYEEEDIITNYHVGQILDLRDQLLEMIKQSGRTSG